MRALRSCTVPVCFECPPQASTICGKLWLGERPRSRHAFKSDRDSPLADWDDQLLQGLSGKRLYTGKCNVQAPPAMSLRSRQDRPLLPLRLLLLLSRFLRCFHTAPKAGTTTKAASTCAVHTLLGSLPAPASDTQILSLHMRTTCRLLVGPSTSGLSPSGLPVDRLIPAVRAVVLALNPKHLACRSPAMHPTLGL